MTYGHQNQMECLLNKKSLFSLILLFGFGIFSEKEIRALWSSYSHYWQFQEVSEKGSQRLPSKTLNKLSSKNIDMSLSAHLKDTEHKLQLKKLKIKFLKDPLKKVNSEDFVEEEFESISPGLNLGQDMSMKDSLEDLNEVQERRSGDFSIEAELLNKSFEDEMAVVRKEEKNKAFIKDFLARAREDGYEVILSEDLEIIDVKRIQEKKIYQPQ